MPRLEQQVTAIRAAFECRKGVSEMATILYFRWTKKSTKFVPEYIVISETEPEILTEEEVDNWCDTGYRLYSKHKIEGDVVQLPCDTILVPGRK